MTTPNSKLTPEQIAGVIQLGNQKLLHLDRMAAKNLVGGNGIDSFKTEIASLIASLDSPIIVPGVNVDSQAVRLYMLSNRITAIINLALQVYLLEGVECKFEGDFTSDDTDTQFVVRGEEKEAITKYLK